MEKDTRSNHELLRNQNHCRRHFRTSHNTSRKGESTKDPDVKVSWSPSCQSRTPNARVLFEIHLWKVLELSHNEIETLPERLFESNTELSRIRLDGNRLHSIPHQLFHGLFKITSINLSRNFLNSVHRKAFQRKNSTGIFRYSMILCIQTITKCTRSIWVIIIWRKWKATGLKASTPIGKSVIANMLVSLFSTRPDGLHRTVGGKLTLTILRTSNNVRQSMDMWLHNYCVYWIPRS